MLAALVAGVSVLLAAACQWPWCRARLPSAKIGQHQGRQNLCPVWLLRQPVVLVVVSVFAVWGCPPKTRSGSATFEFRFIHRTVGGVSNIVHRFMPVPGYRVGRHGQCQGAGSVITCH